MTTMVWPEKWAGKVWRSVYGTIREADLRRAYESLTDGRKVYAERISGFLEAIGGLSMSSRVADRALQGRRPVRRLGRREHRRRAGWRPCGARGEPLAIDPDDTNNDSDKCPDCLTAWSGICKPCKGKGVTS